MPGSILRTALLVASLAAAPLAVAQETVPIPEQESKEVVEGAGVNDMHPAFMLAFPTLGILFVLAVIAIANYGEYRQHRARLASIERLVAAGLPVPRELAATGPPPLTLPEQRRHDVRRGITMLAWAIGIGLVFYFTSGGSLRATSWGLLLLLPSLGNFVKAWLTAREIGRGGADGPR